ncbi:MAG: hypothetical protein OXG96_06745 [Acidobacteria bacterium]|nr:hypothetical protein [Acidobacteriota bacterium]
MARHYSARNFFRHMPKDLLARYSESRGLGSELDLDAWLKLPEERRRTLEAEFREIFELSCEKGTWAILDEARCRWRDDPDGLTAFIETLSSQPSHAHRALSICLDDPECWKGATRVRHPDLLPQWRKRRNLGHRPAATDADSLKHLAELIGSYFQRCEARGRHCLVESVRRGELDFFYAYPEDYSRQEMEWTDGELGPRQHRPAFEVVFVYCRKEGWLDLNFPGPYRALEPLQEMFATAILKLDRLPDTGDAAVYDLNPLCRRGFEFVCGRESGIEAVAVRQIRLSSQSRQGDRITIEADDSIGADAIHDLLDLMGRVMPPHVFNVTQAELVALVTQDKEKLARRVPFRLTAPASCSLGYGERDLRLRSMLKASGLEPEANGRDLDRGPKTVFLDLVSRVGASPAGEVRVSSHELARWPGEAVSALKSQKLIRRARRAPSTVCQGCGRQCAMPVERGTDPSMPWIVCDKRGDINRVPVSADRLAQWRTSTGILGRFVAEGLSLRWRGPNVAEAGALEIGKVAGRKLKLRIEGESALVTVTSALALPKVLVFGDGGFGLEQSRIRRWLDATAAAERPLASSHIRREVGKLDTRKKHKDWQRAYRALRREKPGMTDVWYSRQIARSGLGGGHRPDTIRKNMKK